MSNQQIKNTEQITKTNLEEFKKLVRRAIFLNHSEEAFFNSVPDHTWRTIFSKNFDGNFEYAKRALLYKYKEIEKIDTAYVDKEKNKILNLNQASNFMKDAINNKEKIVFITDFDNDGSLAQAVINEYLEMDKSAAKNMLVEYAQTVNGNTNRGFTVDHVDLIVDKKNINPESAFLIVTADNGINSREEQKKILSKYPKAKIIVTDHHNPDPDMVIEENDRTVIFNPHYKPTSFFKKYNISGATTIGVLLKKLVEERFTEDERAYFSKNYEKLSTLFKVANLLDYVDTHPADKPEKDYIITKFLKLQPLMNINNSISKIITGEIPVSAIEALEKKIPKLNVGLIYDEAKNIHTQNTIAKILLHIYSNRNEYEINPAQNELSKEDFNSIFLKEINNQSNYFEFENINPNYIEQLRPLIFGFAADYNKTPFLDELEEHMVQVYHSIKLSEKRMGDELRKGEVVTKTKLDNSVIAYADPNILKIFNRKFLNKVYNDENPGFSLTLDNIKDDKVSGSFRSLYDISAILVNKKKIEKELKVKIETPGHERAAGFILTSKDPVKNPITASTIEALNSYINTSIKNIKEKEIKSTKDYILTDLTAIKLIDRINKVVRGNVSNFEKITPLLQLTPDTVWTDSYTTEQFTMKEVIESKKYGYITINTDFHDGTIIVPVELIRKIVENNYKDYLSLGYMDGGVFMVDRLVPEKQAQNIIDMRSGSSKTKALEEAFELDFKEKNIVELSRSDIANNPFFKYHDYGQLNLSLFERMVIGIIDTNKIDFLSVFDVEANGFGNSKLINIGTTNYSIDTSSGNIISSEDFFKNLFRTSRKEDYLLTSSEIKEIKEITEEEYFNLPIGFKKVVLQQYDDNAILHYYLPNDFEKISKKKSLPFTQIQNYIANSDNTVTYNRAIKATMLAYLVKDKDFKVPQEMINLTGITQDLLAKYGKETALVDKELFEFYKDKKVLFGAHNTPYDTRVCRANLPSFYSILKENKIYDSALFAKDERLAYDAVTVSKIEQLKEINSNVLFYNNKLSDFNLTKFIEEDKNGYYPDRTNNYLLEIDNGDYYFVDKILHEKIKINATKEEMLLNITPVPIPLNSTKYSVEKLSEQWMIHALLLNDEKFEIKAVDITQPKYSLLSEFAEEIKFFQENYHFDIEPDKNIFNFKARYLTDIIENEGKLSDVGLKIKELTEEFLSLNKDIVQKFSDAWMYKTVLEIKDPTTKEITNDLIDLIFYQTAIPKDKIEKIFKEAISFKEKYKIDHIIQHEMHANGPWRTDVKGDVAFEDKLTLCLLANKEYNPYSHDISHALDKFNEFQTRAKVIFDSADGLGENVAQDSYSFRQGVLYYRDELSPMIKGIQSREGALTEKEKHVIKYKLDNDVLPPKTSVNAVVKEDVFVSREKIEEHKKMLSFILLNEQLGNSMSEASVDTEAKASLLKIYEENKEICLDYKKDLSQYYSFVEYSKSDANVKSFLDKAVDIAVYGKVPKTENKKLILTDTNKEMVESVENIVNKIIQSSSEFHAIKPANVLIVNKMLRDRLSFSVNTMLENALEQHSEITDFVELCESNFLHSIDIGRKKPVERLMEKHKEYRLINKLIETNQKNALTIKKTLKNEIH